MKSLIAAGLVFALGACAGDRPPRAMHIAAEETPEARLSEVTAALRALGPGVDPAEAARAADIALRDPLHWAREWDVTDPPLIHNFKVVNGFRDKGVCQDWADALEIALHAQRFRTLDLHRAIANGRTLSLEHATVVVTASGQDWSQGLVLDPWRLGQGRLWWGRVDADPRYDWESRESYRAWRDAWQARSRQAPRPDAFR
ncbi:hypothetical protein AL036_16610 [Salipiger aestuarii]|uniref:hypothetical protein n=1 Tax=Salipiger aestuarii TaxID=568098 RepID=UPI00025B7F1F|nr:hypothetical protein [Salipiger aestuarii]EIE48962.1 putative lipoprotein [Citreicella sp. 357]KAA8605934.1 hypothetical protein AL036_16610 [Salipiger aestuarii]KAA8608785.1 hypothetical protein AL037_16355 [Salipiger aestuarii]